MTKHASAQEPEYDFDSPIPKGDEFKVIDNGLGTFEVISMTKKRKEFNNLGVCNTAVLTLLITNAETGESNTIEENLTLHGKTMWKVYQFFTAIGQRAHGDKAVIQPKWDEVPGSTGQCLIGTRSWDKKDGSKAFANQIEKYLTEDEAQAEAAKTTF